MTETEINQAIEEALSGGDRWTLKKRGLYYRPNAKGYTNNLSEAWIITEAEADKHTYPHDEPVTKHRVPPRNFYRDLNACAEMEEALGRISVLGCRDQFEVQDFYAWNLQGVCWDEFRQTFLLVHATAPQRCEAFLKTIGKWKE